MAFCGSDRDKLSISRNLASTCSIEVNVSDFETHIPGSTFTYAISSERASGIKVT